MFGIGWQELLILTAIAGVIIGVILAAKRRKLVHLAAAIGFLQGLANVGFAVFGGAQEYHLHNQFQASVAVIFMLVQGAAMVTFAVAAYRGRLYGAYGLLIFALLYAVLSLIATGTPGWIIPPLIYSLAVISLHRAGQRPK